MGITKIIRQQPLTTSTRTAGTRTASTATTTNRIAGGNAKAGTWAGINVINTNSSTGIQETLFNQELQTAIFKNFVIIFWLIQSQPQRGACSAPLHQGNT